jgi:hypothetical protein
MFTWESICKNTSHPSSRPQPPDDRRHPSSPPPPLSSSITSDLMHTLPMVCVNSFPTICWSYCATPSPMPVTEALPSTVTPRRHLGFSSESALPTTTVLDTWCVQTVVSSWVVPLPSDLAAGDLLAGTRPSPLCPSPVSSQGPRVRRIQNPRGFLQGPWLSVIVLIRDLCVSIIIISCE